jgi:hypothetical protein
VVSSPMTEQLHCSGPTGRISWIMRTVVGLWSFAEGNPMTNAHRRASYFLGATGAAG